MDNFICINGRTAQLTPDQLKALGVAVPQSFGDYSLSEIVDITRNGEAQKRFKVRQIKEVGDYRLEIIGFNHDKNANNPDAPSITVMARRIIGRRRMNGGACNEGWEGSELRKWLNGDFINTLPKELVSVIQPTLRVTYDSAGREHKTVDRLFLPNESELFGSAIYSPCMAGERYEAFETSKDRVRIDADDDDCGFWTASTSSGSTSAFVFVSNGGNVIDLYASYAFGAPLCFQIS